MATEVNLPELGESVTEGTVTRWLKQVGDQVAVDEPLLEVSTDKVDTEIPSPVAGTLLEIKAAEDETVDVGAVLAVIGAADESAGGDDDDSSDDGQAEPAQEAEPEQEPVPEQAAETPRRSSATRPTVRPSRPTPPISSRRRRAPIPAARTRHLERRSPRLPHRPRSRRATRPSCASPSWASRSRREP
jgi:pyruvate dehydrogenase E2 component (dihydrolipoamide acetyltransferase)